MIPITTIPQTIWTKIQAYRKLFCTNVGFEHIARYITGLIVSPNKTLQGIHDIQVWPNGNKISSRAMHEAVFEAGWQSDELMPHHRKLLGTKYKGKSRYIISLDWTHGHHDRGPKIFGVKKSYDYVNGRHGLFQTVLTATVANAERQDGIEIEIQQPFELAKEKSYLKATAGQNYDTLEAARERLLELLHYEIHRRSYRKITEMAVDVVRKIEDENHFPQADYAFDNGVLNLDLTREIENRSKQWTSELESSRHINWKGVWRRIDGVAAELKQQHPESFRRVEYPTRSGEIKICWGFSKAVRLKKYGKKRILIVHEKEDLSDKPCFLVTSALHWEAKRILTSWSYRWSCEIFHEFGKQSVGFEAAQVRKEEAVKRHFRLSCVAQSFLQDIAPPVSTSEKFLFAEGQATQGQRERVVVREVLLGMLAFAQQSFVAGKNLLEVLDLLMPV
jgi:hypothetical protein